MTKRMIFDEATLRNNELDDFSDVHGAVEREGKWETWLTIAFLIAFLFIGGLALVGYGG